MTRERPTRVRSLLCAIVLAAALPACSTSRGEAPADAGADVPIAPPAWAPVLQGLDGALLSIWGTSERDVWSVGGPLGNSGLEALVMRFDGEVWTRARPGGPETFWWIHGTSATDVWLVGEKGRITHWNGTSFEERASGTSATLFGVWAAAPDDAWAVGGTPDQPSAENDVVLHWNGAGWKPEVLPELEGASLFKVWGSNKDDVYVVGDAGLVWHRVGGAWKREAQGLATGRLTTVTGCAPNEIIAVGGRDLLTSNGGAWQRSSVPLVNDVNGVACASPALARDAVTGWGRAVIVGGGSLKLRLVGETWVSDFGTAPFTDLHGAWVDPTGAFWGVGGQFAAAARPGASREGVVARYGPGTVSGIIRD